MQVVVQVTHRNTSFSCVSRAVLQIWMKAGRTLSALFRNTMPPVLVRFLSEDNSFLLHTELLENLADQVCSAPGHSRATVLGTREEAPKACSRFALNRVCWWWWLCRRGFSHATAWRMIGPAPLNLDRWITAGTFLRDIPWDTLVLHTASLPGETHFSALSLKFSTIVCAPAAGSWAGLVGIGGTDRGR